jgi:dynein heavy chain
LDQEEWRYLLTGPTGDFKILTNTTDWIAESSWQDIFMQFHGMQDIANLKGLY